MGGQGRRDARGNALRLTVAFCSLLVVAATSRAAGQPPINPVGIDFSFAGFQGGGKSIPQVAAVIHVRPSGGDDTGLLQSAIDHVASLPIGKNGFRGAILLAPGRFLVRGQLHLNTSGIVLRGSGQGPGGTTIRAEGIDRRTLIQVGGELEPTFSSPVAITGERVEAGARTLHVATTQGLLPGDRIAVTRPSTAEWIKAEGMSGLLGTFADQRVDWKPGSHDLVWVRTISAVDAAAKTIEFDAPITFRIDGATGGGTVAAWREHPPVSNVGVENLQLDSSYDPANPKDEEHSWIAIALDNVEDAWVQGVAARHFVSSAVRAGRWARRITIQDSRSEAPVAEEGGYRRQAFAIYGQQVLVLRCYSESAMNDFATGLLAAGPNVFLECEAANSLEASGSFEGLAAGVLYESVRVPNSRVQLLLDQTRAQAAGWTAVNSLIWNSTAKSLDALGPYDGMNYVVTAPQPLYRSELTARGLQLRAPYKPLPASASNVPEFRGSSANPAMEPQPHPFQIVNGRFVVEGKVAYGESFNETWWHGNTSPAVAGTLTGSSITRFMPGQSGPGLTEDLQELASRLSKRGIIFYQSIPGLWYEHRRDEHTVTRQQNGDVWAPFFEMPWARSGKGIAWDGLSRYDLTRYNPWYFQRCREFAQIAGEHGLIVFHNLYNTHDVLEIGPHWIDFPWRPANNINDTGLPEPPPFQGGYTVAMDTVQPTVTKLNVGNQFYSVDYPPLRKLHHDYIFHVLDELGDMPNVVFTIAYQYAGPLAFVQFFQDTVAEWEKLHGRSVRLALITSKGITDAILSDPARSKQIAVVDMRYWYYLSDGTLFAPEAGQNRAYRDWITTRFGGPYTNTGPPTTQEQVYREIREYRDRHPNLALLPMENGAGPLPLLMAGAASQSSLRAPQSSNDRQLSTDAIIDKFVQDNLADTLMKLNPVDGVVADSSHNWALAGSATDPVLIDSRGEPSVTLAKSLGSVTYRGMWFDPASGRSTDAGYISGLAGTVILKPTGDGWLLLLRPTAQPQRAPTSSVSSPGF